MNKIQNQLKRDFLLGNLELDKEKILHRLEQPQALTIMKLSM